MTAALSEYTGLFVDPDFEVSYLIDGKNGAGFYWWPTDEDCKIIGNPQGPFDSAFDAWLKAGNDLGARPTANPHHRR